MARPPRTVASRFGTPLPAKLAASVTLFETTATFLALMILNDSVLSWLGLDYVVSAPWRWPLFWLLSLVVLAAVVRRFVEDRHIAAQKKEARRNCSALDRVQF